MAQNAKGLGVIGRHGSLSRVSGGEAFAPSRLRMVRRALERSLESTTVSNTSTRDAGFYEMTLSRTIWRCFAPQTSSSVLELGLRFPSEGSPWAFEIIPPLRYAVGTNTCSVNSKRSSKLQMYPG